MALLLALGLVLLAAMVLPAPGSARLVLSDEEADVLCVSICRPRKPAGVDIGQGVIVRYDEQRREVVGVRTCGIRRR